MAEARSEDFALSARNSPVSRLGAACFASISCLPQSPATRLLRIQQSSSDDVQVDERSGDFQPVQVLRQAPVPDFPEAEDVLDHAEHVLDLRAHPRLVAVLRFLTLVDLAVVAVAAVREVLRLRCSRANDRRLALIPLVTPDPRLVAVQ